MIQVYTGNGKGKTTAALGLALRAAGAGRTVFIGQFVKGREYSELKSLRKISRIAVEQFGRSCFVRKAPTSADFACARKGFERIQEIIRTHSHNVIILDEINIAVHLKLLELKEMVAFLERVPDNVEVVLTGRHAHPAIIKIADLVSNIQEKKHYLRRGIRARRGIEF
jgi:cob(I)alamin adenosyltransferase